VLTGESVVDLDPEGPDDVAADIELQPTLSIEGTVHCADGDPCVGQIAAIPIGGFEGDFMRIVPDSIGADGRFEISGLLPGSYDLDVRPLKNYVFTDCLLSQRFPGIRAGSKELALVLREEDAVRVEIEVAAKDRAISTVGIVTGIFKPYGIRDPKGHEPGAEHTYSGRNGWPPAATLDFGGQTGDESSEGVTAFLHLGGDLPVSRLQPMNEGWYWFGVDAHDAGGTRFHPCGTGLVYLRPGAYHFKFEVVPEAEIGGTVTGTDVDDLCAALVERDGRPVQVLHTSRHLSEVVELGSRGRFQIQGAPVGEFLLRIGSQAQLRDGEFVHEVPVTVTPGVNPPLQIRVP
jgi:hypothetical protein